MIDNYFKVNIESLKGSHRHTSMENLQRGLKGSYSMRKPIIAGNWKMHKTLSEAKSFMEELKIPFHLTRRSRPLFVPLLYF